jgi:hypothetical protein
MKKDNSLLKTLKQKSGKANFFEDINVKFKKMPYPPYVEDPLLTTIEANLPLFLILRIKTGNKYNMLAKSHMYIMRLSPNLHLIYLHEIF